MIVVIDDLRNFKPEIIKNVNDSIIVLRNSKEALKWLEEQYSSNTKTPLDIDQLWLDHDLGMVSNNEESDSFLIEDTTIPFVETLIKYATEGKIVNISIILVHSSNPVGVNNIINKLQPFYKNIVKVNATEYFIV